MQGYAYFPTVIYREEFPEFIKESLAVAEDSYFSADQENELSHQIIQTGDVSSDPRLAGLTSRIIEESTSIIDSQGYALTGATVFIADLWAQKFGYLANNLQHVHSNRVLSGFYFLTVPKNSGHPLFSDPRQGKMMSDLPLKSNEKVDIATPNIAFDNIVNGTMLIFNSWLPHLISSHRSYDPLKFIHFNVGVK